jgi:hypothetical protein
VAQVEEGIELEGVEGYPYRKFGDSIVWEGKLREKVFLQLNVRILLITESSITVAGTATVFLTP